MQFYEKVNSADDVQMNDVIVSISNARALEEGADIGQIIGEAAHWVVAGDAIRPNVFVCVSASGETSQLTIPKIGRTVYRQLSPTPKRLKLLLTRDPDEPEFPDLVVFTGGGEEDAGEPVVETEDASYFLDDERRAQAIRIAAVALGPRDRHFDLFTLADKIDRYIATGEHPA